MYTSLTLEPQALELLGLTQKDMQVYIALLRLGSAPLRRIAEEANLSRGTTYDVLKRLLKKNIVSYVDAKTHRRFAAEDPQKLRGLATQREVAIQDVRQSIDGLLPELRALAGSAEHRPVVRYYEGVTGVRDILKDVLYSAEKSKKKQYRVYSSSAIRDLIASAWPRFSAERKRRGVSVRAIALGEGGTTVGLDERRWLTREESAPTYIFIYGRKTAYVTQDEHGTLFGAIIEDIGITSTQRLIFDQLWKTLH